MSKAEKLTWEKIGDRLALKIQELHQTGEIDDEQPLLRIDYRKEAVQAPFQFDIVNGKLHRTVCTTIPTGSKSAVYAVWKPQREDIKLSCEKCHPILEKGERMDKNIASDVVAGLLSILDQFGSVLRDRGKEYRNSEQGKAVVKTIHTLMSGLDRKQQEVLHVMFYSLDQLLKVVEGCNATLQGRRNGKNRNGINGNGSGRSKRQSQNKRNSKKNGKKRFDKRSFA